MIELKTRYARRDLGPMIKMLGEAIVANEEDGDPSGMLDRQREVLATYEAMYEMGDVANYRENEVPEDDETPESGGSPREQTPKRMPRKATPEALNYIRKLLKERGMTLADAKLTEDHFTDGHFRRLTAKDAYDITENLKTIDAPELMMSDGQRDLLAKLAIESGVSEAVALEAWENLQKKITQDQASKMIDRAIAAAKKAPKRRTGTPEEGFYMCGDAVIKVQRGTTTDSIYVKTLRLIQGVGHEWDYQGNAAKYFATQLKGKDVQPLTAERALEIGRQIGDDLELYGECWMCGRKLTDEESMRRKVGRICINKL